LLHWNSN